MGSETRADAVARALATGAAQQARAAFGDLVSHTPMLTSASLTERVGGTILLKAENLQRTGSFKIRGALRKLMADEPTAGVVAGSAGNHAQALAYAARARGVSCEVFMPAQAPASKVAAVQSYGGTVVLGGVSVEECIAAAKERATASGAMFVHPFDDEAVIVGQATLALEILDDTPTLGALVVPVGGGGLISGMAVVLKTLRPDVRIVGVQVEASAAFAPSIEAGKPVAITPTATIADGIAVAAPGLLTLPLVTRWVDELCVVREDDVGEAMAMLMERAKLVVEGAGAVGVAALLAGAVEPDAQRPTVVVLSGGNVDSGLLAAVARRQEIAVGRLLRITTRIADRPGGLAALLGTIAAAGGNLIAVAHVREASRLHVRQTAVELTLETRGAEHGVAILTALEDAGYTVERLDE